MRSYTKHPWVNPFTHRYTRGYTCTRCWLTRVGYGHPSAGLGHLWVLPGHYPGTPMLDPRSPVQIVIAGSWIWESNVNIETSDLDSGNSKWCRSSQRRHARQMRKSAHAQSRIIHPGGFAKHDLKSIEQKRVHGKSWNMHSARVGTPPDTPDTANNSLHQSRTLCSTDASRSRFRKLEAAFTPRWDTRGLHHASGKSLMLQVRLRMLPVFADV